MESLKLEKGLFKITAVIVGIFSLVLVLNLLSFRPKYEVKTQTSSRVPASVAISSVINEVETSTLNYSLPCIQDGESYSIKSESPRLRIGSKLCQIKDHLKESTIVNKSNGFVATVFHINSKEFTTDLIDLIPGENQIHVSHLLNNGKTVLSHIVISY